jgi:hypothetical protein
MNGSVHPRLDLSPEQEGLWARVQELWRLAAKKDADGVRSALHPRYTGWERESPMPHDREWAVASIARVGGEVRQWQLHPLAIEVFDGTVGVVHYYFRASVEGADTPPALASGRWTEIYSRRGDAWLLISVTGGPDSNGR